MQRNSDPTLAYRQTATESTTALGLVVLLYERAIDDMRLAVAAMREQNLEQRTGHINHAFLILQQLQGTLDFEQGGIAARQLDQFYGLVRAKLLEAQIRQSTELMQQQIRLMAEIRECWVEADRRAQPKRDSAPPAVATPAHPETGAGVEWRA